MTSINISLPTVLRRFVEAQVTAGGFGNTSEYIRHLLRRELAQDHLEEMLLEGKHSGPARELTEKDWSDLHKIAGRRPTSRKSG